MRTGRTHDRVWCGVLAAVLCLGAGLAGAQVDVDPDTGDLATEINNNPGQTFTLLGKGDPADDNGPVAYHDLRTNVLIDSNITIQGEGGFLPERIVIRGVTSAADPCDPGGIVNRDFDEGEPGEPGFGWTEGNTAGRAVVVTDGRSTSPPRAAIFTAEATAPTEGESGGGAVIEPLRQEQITRPKAPMVLRFSYRVEGAPLSEMLAIDFADAGGFNSTISITPGDTLDQYVASPEIELASEFETLSAPFSLALTATAVPPGTRLYIDDVYLGPASGYVAAEQNWLANGDFELGPVDWSSGNIVGGDVGDGSQFAALISSTSPDPLIQNSIMPSAAATAVPLILSFYYRVEGQVLTEPVVIDFGGAPGLDVPSALSLEDASGLYAYAAVPVSDDGSALINPFSFELTMTVPEGTTVFVDDIYLGAAGGQADSTQNWLVNGDFGECAIGWTSGAIYGGGVGRNFGECAALFIGENPSEGEALVFYEATFLQQALSGGALSGAATLSFDLSLNIEGEADDTPADFLALRAEGDFGTQVVFAVWEDGFAVGDGTNLEQVTVNTQTTVECELPAGTKQIAFESLIEVGAKPVVFVVDTLCLLASFSDTLLQVGDGLTPGGLNLSGLTIGQAATAVQVVNGALDVTRCRVESCSSSGLLFDEDILVPGSTGTGSISSSVIDVSGTGVQIDNASSATIVQCTFGESGTPVAAASGSALVAACLFRGSGLGSSANISGYENCVVETDCSPTFDDDYWYGKLDPLVSANATEVSTGKDWSTIQSENSPALDSASTQPMDFEGNARDSGDVERGADEWEEGDYNIAFSCAITPQDYVAAGETVTIVLTGSVDDVDLSDSLVYLLSESSQADASSAGVSFTSGTTLPVDVEPYLYPIPVTWVRDATGAGASTVEYKTSFTVSGTFGTALDAATEVCIDGVTTFYLTVGDSPLELFNCGGPVIDTVPPVAVESVTASAIASSPNDRPVPAPAQEPNADWPSLATFPPMFVPDPDNDNLLEDGNAAVFLNPPGDAPMQLSMQIAFVDPYPESGGTIYEVTTAGFRGFSAAVPPGDLSVLPDEEDPGIAYWDAVPSAVASAVGPVTAGCAPVAGSLRGDPLDSVTLLALWEFPALVFDAGAWPLDAAFKATDQAGNWSPVTNEVSVYWIPEAGLESPAGSFCPDRESASLNETSSPTFTWSLAGEHAPASVVGIYCEPMMRYRVTNLEVSPSSSEWTEWSDWLRGHSSIDSGTPFHAASSYYPGFADVLAETRGHETEIVIEVIDEAGNLGEYACYFTHPAEPDVFLGTRLQARLWHNLSYGVFDVNAPSALGDPADIDYASTHDIPLPADDCEAGISKRVEAEFTVTMDYPEEVPAGRVYARWELMENSRRVAGGAIKGVSSGDRSAVLRIPADLFTASPHTLLTPGTGWRNTLTGGAQIWVVYPTQGFLAFSHCNGNASPADRLGDDRPSATAQLLDPADDPQRSYRTRDVTYSFIVRTVEDTDGSPDTDNWPLTEADAVLAQNPAVFSFTVSADRQTRLEQPVKLREVSN